MIRVAFLIFLKEKIEQVRLSYRKSKGSLGKLAQIQEVERMQLCKWFVIVFHVPMDGRGPGNWNGDPTSADNRPSHRSLFKCFRFLIKSKKSWPFQNLKKIGHQQVRQLESGRNATRAGPPNKMRSAGKLMWEDGNRLITTWGGHKMKSGPGRCRPVTVSGLAR